MLRFLTLLALLGSAGLTAQSSQLIDSIRLGGLPLQIMVEDVTSTPIVAQQYSYVGLDRMTGDSIWSVARKALSGLTQKMSEDNDDVIDLVDIPNVPYIYVNGVIVDVRDGKKLVTEDEEVKLFRASYVVNDLNLVEVAVKGGTRLYGFGATDGSRRFAIDLKDQGGLGLAGNAEGEGNRPPMVLDADNIIYFDNKNIYRINTGSGELLWDYEGKVKTIIPVDNGKRYALLFRPGGLMSLADYDKDFQLLDATTGAPAFKKKPLKMDGNLREVIDHEGGLAIIHSDGLNIYDFGAEDGRWKKDFKENGISRFEMEDGGMMVYFKNKRMLVDPKTGEEQMKKAEKLERTPYTGPKPRGKFMFAGKEITIWGSNSIEVDGAKMNFGRIAFDEATGLIAMATPFTEGSNMKKEYYNYTISTYNVNTKAKGSLPKQMITSGIDELDIVGNRIVATGANGRFVQAFTLDGSQPSAGKVFNFGQIKRGGEGMRKLLGGKEEVPESISGYFTADSDFYDAAIQEGFEVAAYNNSRAKFVPVLGMKRIANTKASLPYLSVMDKASGESIMEDLIFYNNASFTVDPKQNILYVIHGNSIRWYQF